MVSPDRVQHFTSDSVSLNCEGNSTEWRVKLTESGNILFCQNWGTMTGSTCSIERYRSSNAVYWCESGSGEFSNAVNITISSNHIILVSPVHPVTEGDSVSLICRIKRKTFASKVFFYQNGKLIQNDTRRELNISAVSKSDEGFYKCEYSQKVSAQSWMSVKGVSRPESSSSPVLMIIGLVFGIVLVILLLLLYRYRRSKDSCFIRPVQSESTNRGSATGHMVNQNEAQQNDDPSPLRGDSHLYEPVKGSEARLYESIKGSEARLYESIQGSEARLYESIQGSEARLYESIKRSEDADNDTAESQDDTYSLIELKNFGRKGKRHEPEESCLYSDVNIGTAGKSTASATDETSP
uniref:low affinity immunoglobulin gamma Fc region receptor II-like n=1 Tax=Epinephelus lanceolatus TaxID=310571 RepID=UPI00144868DB|nr:low affinity immunoglobulin gamma Fc region receptor II-like [Epinephelus lanceolatus]